MPIYNNALEGYLRTVFSPEDAILAHIREQIRRRGLPAISVRPEEGRFLQFLVAACGAQRALEIGTLGGYSGTWIARGLPASGRLITLELEPAHAEVAREHFALAGLEQAVELRVGDAHALLRDLAREGPFDFVFIDAEKEGYPAYLDWSLHNLRPGGVLAAHNAFRRGAIVEPGTDDPRVAATQRFNQLLAQHPGLIASVYPGGDGIALAVFRPVG
jgi:caffeoyl-CoA O-methyltransferase